MNLIVLRGILTIKAAKATKGSIMFADVVPSRYKRFLPYIVAPLIIIIGAIFIYTPITYAANIPPRVGTITPSSGISLPDKQAIFTTTYFDSNGYQDLSYCYLLINTSVSSTNSVYAYYARAANKLYFYDYSQKKWLGPITPGTDIILETPWSKLDCKILTVTGSANTITIKWPITFKQAFSGNKNTYLNVRDVSSILSGWIQRGIWKINIPPQVGTIAPSSGITFPDKEITFTTTYKDSNGYQDINYCYFLINSSVSSANSVYAYYYYYRKSNQLYFYDYSQKKWLGPITPGTDTVLETKWGKLDCKNTTITGAANTLTIKWPITFKQAFSGNKNIYLNVRDASGILSGWIQKGTLKIQSDTISPAGAIKINKDSQYANSPTVTLTLSAFDNSGGSGIDKMQFSNDNVNWSAPEVYAVTKTWTLSSGDGEKTVYAKFSDKAGNWSTAVSDAIVLYTGILVTVNEGGIVNSPDGKVKIVVPSGALMADIRIGVICPDPRSFESAAPNNYSLYVVADCQPNNIIFYKPVQLIFTLDNPQIPGTPVYLGLYNEIDGKIELEEFSSFVAADGITVTFLVSHFSTYAAMQGMLSQGAAIGASTKTPLPDLFTGSFSHSIPIAVPPGRKGIQPGLNIQYRSSSPNSWAGVGWALNTGYITRQARKGLPTYDDSKDTFTFVSDSFATELAYLVDNLYQAKIEGAFMKFYKQPDDSWKVVSKDGSYMLLGINDTARELGLNSFTYSWYLTKAVDNNSNYITYDYTKDQGKCYLSRIEYTGNERMCVSGEYSVNFYLEDRSDIQTSFASGAKITTAKRLKNIEVLFGNDLVWKYELDYIYSADTGRSLLKNFTQYTSDGKPFPVQAFNYQASK